MKLQLFNGVALAVILALATWGATRSSESLEPRGTVVVASPLPGIPETLVDVRGQTVKTGDYQRIVSLNSVADPILLELIEPNRLVGVSEYSRSQHPEGFRYADRPALARSDDLEAILALKPDLVLASKFADEAFMARIREGGTPVFDLGEMRGVGSTVLTIRILGQLVRQPARAAHVESDYLLRLAALDASVPDEAEVPGLYLSIYGDSLFGGTSGTSYADMLHYAGIHDVAAEHGYTEWPKFSPEQLLAIDPPLVVTQSGMATLLCTHSTLRDLACCQQGGRVIEVPGKYHSDPGLGLVAAATAVQQLVHPDRTPTAPERAPSVQHLVEHGAYP